MKHIPWIIFIFVLIFHPVSRVQAQVKEAGATAVLASTLPQEDPRRIRLASYLMQYNPELSAYAGQFVEQADKAGIDWKLVVAIAGLESTFCKRIPVGSYNCWGWGIPTGASSGIAFAGFTDGIATVSQGLRLRYYDKGLLTIDQIGRVYAASPTWAQRVRAFMASIESFTDNPDKEIAFNL